MTAQIPLRHVQAGDVISADFTNSLIDTVLDLETRVSELEGGTAAAGGAVAITGLVPAGPVHIGDDLQILGRNFGFSMGTQRVFFNSTRTNVYRTGSNDSSLIIQIPDVPEVTAAGGATQVTMTVANQSSSDTRQVTLLPAVQVQQGNIFIDYLGPDQATPTPAAGSSFKVDYRLESQALLPTAVTITPSVSGLAAQTQVVDTTTQQPLQQPLTLHPTQVVTFSVVLAIPANAAANTPFSLSVTASGSDKTGSQDAARNFSVGQAAGQVDPAILLSTNTALPAGAVNGTTITAAQGSQITVQLKAEFSDKAVTGTPYNLSVATAAGTSGWAVQLATSILFSTPPSYILNTVPAIEFPAFTVTPQAGASSTGQVIFTIQRQGSNVSQTKTYTLQLG